jgi:hypothetical protein
MNTTAPATDAPILRFFRYDHLPTGEARDVSRMFANLAHEVHHRLPAGAESATALRKLLEGKDAAVRAALDLVEVAR